MPDTTRSAWKPSISPSLARRTQSTGVPSVAYPMVPSSNGTSCTQSGRRVVIMRAKAERLPSGAMTATSTPGTFSSARRSACRPSASMPSSLVTSTRMRPSQDSRGPGTFLPRDGAPGRPDTVVQPLVARHPRRRPVVPERIERDILIDAPVEIVWAVVTEPEHIGSWFSESAELDLRPGGKALLHWDEYGTVQGRVERVEPPHVFSFRWVVDPGTDLTEDNSTLVEFRLSAEGESTRLTVVETGFRDLAVPDEDKQRHVDSHRRGWGLELGDLDDYMAQRTGIPSER